MLKKYLLTIAYDGTNYFGWQRQPREGQITVQEELENACSTLFKKEIKVAGASRTDRGVHALGQKATIDIGLDIPPPKLRLALNTFLPKDIVISSAMEVGEEFHPQYDAKEKTYEYKVFNSKIRNPLYRNYSEFVYGDLDIIKMQAATSAFIGTMDFNAFCAVRSNDRITVRTIYSLEVEKQGDFIIIRVRGNGFLHNMVRIIAGTLIYVGLGKIKGEDIPDIIKSCDRTQAGKTASPCGLCLINVKY